MPRASRFLDAPAPAVVPAFYLDRCLWEVVGVAQGGGDVEPSYVKNHASLWWHAGN